MIYLASHAPRQNARHTIVPIAGGWFMENGARSADRLSAGEWGMLIGLAIAVNIVVAERLWCLSTVLDAVKKT